jgi:hypothetical protein
MKNTIHINLIQNGEVTLQKEMCVMTNVRFDLVELVADTLVLELTNDLLQKLGCDRKFQLKHEITRKE